MRRMNKLGDEIIVTLKKSIGNYGRFMAAESLEYKCKIIAISSDIITIIGSENVLRDYAQSGAEDIRFSMEFDLGEYHFDYDGIGIPTIEELQEIREDNPELLELGFDYWTRSYNYLDKGIYIDSYGVEQAIETNNKLAVVPFLHVNILDGKPLDPDYSYLDSLDLNHIINRPGILISEVMGKIEDEYAEDYTKKTGFSDIFNLISIIDFMDYLNDRYNIKYREVTNYALYK